MIPSVPISNESNDTLENLAALPNKAKVLSVNIFSGISSWATTACIDTEAANGSQKAYFLKASACHALTAARSKIFAAY